MDLRRVRAREQRHDRERLAGIDRAEDDAHLLPARELGRAVHRLGRIALGVAGDQFDLPPVDAAGRVDLLHRQLDSAVDADPGGRRGTGERRKITDQDRLFCRDGGLDDGACKGGSAGRQRLTTSQRHFDFLPKRVLIHSQSLSRFLGPRFLGLRGVDYSLGLTVRIARCLHQEVELNVAVV